MDLQLFRVLFNASIFKTGDKRRPMDNKLEHFTQKERIDLDMLHLLKKRKVAVKHSCSARDQIPRRLVFDSFPFSSFRTPVIGEIDLSSPESVILKVAF